MNKKKDILQRETFIEQIISIVERVSDKNRECTFAINGEWGSGKTFVLEEFENKISEIQLSGTTDDKYLVFHYDAWKYDYYEEPIVAMVSAMLSFMDDENSLFGSKVDIYLKDGALKMLDGLRKVGGDILKHTTGVDVNNIIDEALSIKKNVDGNQMERFEFDYFLGFRNAILELKKVISSLTEDRTLIIVVDEIDRCLPQYSIKILERLHHIFSDLEKVIIIIAVDGNQLNCAVKKIYGEKTEVGKYLKKFISFEMILEKNSSECFYKENFSRYFEKFNVQDNNESERCDEFLNNLFEDLDIRSVEKYFEKAEIIHDLIAHKKTDISLLCFELLSVTVSDLQQHNRLAWLIKLESQSIYTIEEKNVGKKRILKLREQIKKHVLENGDANSVVNYDILDTVIGRMYYYICFCYYNPEKPAINENIYGKLIFLQKEAYKKECDLAKEFLELNKIIK